MATITCSKCGEALPGGTLLRHDLAKHPRAAAAPAALKACRKPACVDLHGGKHYHDPARGVVR